MGESVRGPSPKAEKWPKAGQQPNQVHPKRSQSASRGRPQSSTRQLEKDSDLPRRRGSRPPEAVAVEAILEVERLQGAIAALGEGNPHSVPMKEALSVARAKSKVLPANESIGACKSFIGRAKKRLIRMEVVIATHEQKSIFETELRDGGARLLQLQTDRVRGTTTVGRRVATKNRPVG